IWSNLTLEPPPTVVEKLCRRGADSPLAKSATPENTEKNAKVVPNKGVILDSGSVSWGSNPCSPAAQRLIPEVQVCGVFFAIARNRARIKGTAGTSETRTAGVRDGSGRGFG